MANPSPEVSQESLWQADAFYYREVPAKPPSRYSEFEHVMIPADLIHAVEDPGLREALLRQSQQRAIPQGRMILQIVTTPDDRLRRLFNAPSQPLDIPLRIDE